VEPWCSACGAAAGAHAAKSPPARAGTREDRLKSQEKN